MKPQSTEHREAKPLSVLHGSPTSLRCAYLSPTGRRCRFLAANAQSSLCPHHLAEQKQLEDADYFDDLSRYSQQFQTAQGINHSLGKLYELLAKNKISARRAAVLSYITSLLLHTLPQIDKDNEAGITSCPTAPNLLPQTTSLLALAPSHANPQPGSHASDAISQADANPAPDPANASSL